MRKATFIVAASAAAAAMAPSAQAATVVRSAAPVATALSDARPIAAWCVTSDCSKPAFVAENLPGTLPVAASAPEPAVWALLILGFGLVAGALRRSRQAGAIA